jgi:hypothetical protein
MRSGKAQVWCSGEVRVSCSGEIWVSGSAKIEYTDRVNVTWVSYPCELETKIEERSLN